VAYADAIGIAAIEARVTALAERLRQRLAEVPGVTVRDQGVRRSGIVTFETADEPADRLAARLAAARIAISVTRPEHARLDFGPRGLGPLARASVHYYNTEDEVDRFVAALAGRPGAG
jgi:selenocysteine lyase/cysteine desulfurase